MEHTRRFPRLRHSGLGLVLLLLVLGAAWGLLRLRRGVESLAPQPPPSPPAPLQPTGITVEVLNGSGRRGLARIAARALREQGFDVLFFGTASDPVPLTEVLARRGDSLAAVRVARALGAGQVRLARDTLLRLDVTVRLGDDYQPPPGIRP